MIPIEWLGESVDLIAEKYHLLRLMRMYRPGRGRTGWMPVDHEVPDEADPEAFYRTVCDFFGGDTLQLSRRGYTDAETDSLIACLAEAGFPFPRQNFSTVMKLARKMRDAREKEAMSQTDRERISSEEGKTTHRYASLNSYDFSRLRDELDALRGMIGSAALEDMCPKLIGIYHEAINSDDEEYRGRHLSLSRLGGRKAWRFQCLRIMDRILHTVGHHLSDDEMRRAMEKEASALGLIGKFDSIDIGSSLAKNYRILSELISSGKSRGVAGRYERSAYEGGYRGHRYRLVGGADPTERVMAFKMEFTMREAMEMAVEIQALRTLCFADADDVFESRFPLLTAMGNIGSYRGKRVEEQDNLNGVTYTDLYTVDYLPSESAELREMVRNAVRMEMSIGIKDSVERFVAVSFRENSELWRVIGIGLESGEPRVFGPDDLTGSFEPGPLMPLPPESIALAGHIMGTGAIEPRLRHVTLRLTRLWVDRIMKQVSRYAGLKPVMEPSDEWGICDCGMVSLTFYLNDDFLEWLLDIDCKGGLIEIVGPDEMVRRYEEYFFSHMRKPRPPYESRCGSTKRLKR